MGIGEPGATGVADSDGVDVGGTGVDVAGIGVDVGVGAPPWTTTTPFIAVPPGKLWTWQ